MSTYAALLGVTFTVRRQWKIGLATVVLSLGYLVVVVNLVMPALTEQRYFYWLNYVELGESPRQVLEHVVRHPIASLALLFSTPEKRHTINLMFGSFAYLPVLSWTMWPVLFVTLAERFWTFSMNHWLFVAHYQVVITTLLFVATLYVLHDIGPRVRRDQKVALAAAILILVTTVWAAHASDVWQDAFKAPRPATIEGWQAALRQIPPTARVSAQDAFVPHLAHRAVIYQFPRVRDAEYVVIDPEAATYPATPDDVRAAQQSLPALGWRLVWQQGTTSVFQRTPASRIPPAVLVVVSGRPVVRIDRD